eukprot:1161407-Pelagomonas_calceolata.AAC.7
MEWQHICMITYIDPGLPQDWICFECVLQAVTEEEQQERLRQQERLQELEEAQLQQEQQAGMMGVHLLADTALGGDAAERQQRQPQQARSGGDSGGRGGPPPPPPPPPPPGVWVGVGCLCARARVCVCERGGDAFPWLTDLLVRIGQAAHAYAVCASACGHFEGGNPQSSSLKTTDQCAFAVCAHVCRHGEGHPHTAAAPAAEDAALG